ncbi:hypothetical protein WR164_13690 [Philodulcilactobacillus myokoensis]|uniref:Uncharacterized protein n=1 Tax=Philodulcilactobacillus myokoensis TaxID=2929573 RepID=A0A9W6ET28_9LACO|nr:hypothetical protein [Philodulcilactobacillus myokoensis]GLB47390.1 hypothetical protein WR164_13690 [Philodulcilactobacillus myokoensis]
MNNLVNNDRNINNSIVILNSMYDEPTISADRIADLVKISHRSINKAITRSKKELKRVRFKIASHNKKYYFLNEKQCLKLVGGLRTNYLTKQVRSKLINTLIEQFNQALKIQLRRQLTHIQSKPLTYDFNLAIDNNDTMDSHSYINLNKLAYKIALGMNTSQLKKTRNIPKNKPITEYLTANDFKQVNNIKQTMIFFINQNYSYQEIKTILSHHKLGQKIGA